MLLHFTPQLLFQEKSNNIMFILCCAGYKNALNCVNKTFPTESACYCILKYLFTDLGDKSEDLVEAVKKPLAEDRCESCYGAESAKYK